MARFDLVLVVFVIILNNVLMETHNRSHVCVEWRSNGICVGGDDALSSTDVELTYGVSGNESRMLFKKTSGTRPYELDNCNYNCSYLFEQKEHGGGDCNCVDIFFSSNCSLEHAR